MTQTFLGLVFLFGFGAFTQASVSEESILRDCKSEYAKGEYGAALKSFSRFLRNYPQSAFHAEALYWKGQSFLSEGRQDSARAQWASVSEKAPFWFGRSRFAMAVLAAGEGNERGSNDELTRALRVKDSSLLPSIWFQFYKNRLAAKQQKEALRYADSLKKFFPKALEVDLLGGVAAASTTESQPKPSTGRFTLQLGAFAARANAESLVAKMNGQKNAGSWKAEVVVQQRGSSALYIVRLGRFSDEESARSLASALDLAKGVFRVVPWME